MRASLTSLSGTTIIGTTEVDPDKAPVVLIFDCHAYVKQIFKTGEPGSGGRFIIYREEPSKTLVESDVVRG